MVVVRKKGTFSICCCVFRSLLSAKFLNSTKSVNLIRFAFSAKNSGGVRARLRDANIYTVKYSAGTC